MREDDVEAVNDLAITAFEDLDRRRQEPVAPRMEPDAAYVRYRRLLATDPDGCWVADGDDGALAGAALAILRDGLWGLSLLAVRPGLQSGGLGSALLNRALAYGDGARGGIILSSSDPRALRAYARDRLAHRRPAGATGVAVAARLELRPTGGLFRRGETGSFRPYLPSGAYL
jgi:GNAT superfamily N-acetyltransferase